MPWGMPPPPRTGGPPVTNIRNTSSPHWRRGWLKPENRCLVPANSFAEYAPGPNPETKKLTWCGSRSVITGRCSLSRDWSHRKAIILDAFVGSGTTLIAAETTGRRGYGIEIDPAYCDVTIRRLYAVCGLDAVLDATGRHFAEIEALRATAASPPVEAAPS